MRWLGTLVGIGAALALAGSPLATVAVVVAVLNVVAAVTGIWWVEWRGARAVTALQHLTTALAGFFLFVWLAARS